METILDVVNLVKQYKTCKAVDGISFQVKKGQVFAFLGPNGAGKSTTMMILSTLLSKTSGEVLLEGKDFYLKQNQLKRKIGVVFQENSLDDQLTVYENLFSRGKLYYRDKKQLKEKIFSLAKEMDCLELLTKTYGHCSGGQKRLIMIARALLHEPKFIILDEPTTGLDPQIRKLVWEKLMQYKEEKQLTVFFSSHYMEEATQYADYICIMNQGKIIMANTCEKLIQEYGEKRLHIHESSKDYQIVVHNTQDALSILNRLGYKVKSFELKNASLEDIFLQNTQMMGEAI